MPVALELSVAVIQFEPILQGRKLTFGHEKAEFVEFAVFNAKKAFQNSYYGFYVSQIVTWRRDNLIRLYKLIEKNFERNWLEVISGIEDLSEYVLYGVFSSHVLGEDSGHYDDHLQKICWCYWETSPMSDEKLKEFFQEARSSGHKAVMISAKSSIDLSIEQFRNYLALTQAL